MKQEKLGDLFDYLPKSKIKAGEGLENGEYPFYTSSENQSKFFNDFQNGSGCLVFGTGGKASVHLTTSRFATSTDCISIKPKSIEEIDAGYVFQYLKGNMKVLENGFKGAGLKHISKAYLSNVLIPFPADINDQRRIAHLLGKVEGLIAQRKQHLKQLDDVLKSVFLDMFGDPVKNDRGWKTSTIEGLCNIVVDCPHNTPLYSVQKTGYFCIRSSDIIEGYLNLEKTYNVDRNIYESRIARYTPQKNDIIYSREGGRLGNAGRIIGDEKICLGQRMMLFQVNSANTPEFLWSLLESVYFKSKLQGLIGGGAAPRVNIKDLKMLVVICPPPNLQLSFSKIVLKVDILREQYKLHLTELQALYAAISQKAFKGELDLSRISIPEDTNNHTPTEGVNQLDMPAFLRKSNDPVTPKQIVNFLAQNKLPDDRRALITQWFEHYLADTSPDISLSSAQFLESTWQVLQSERFEIDGETPAITIDDYDMLKKLVFEALSSGKLRQHFEEETNQVRLQKSPDGWGSW